MKKSKKKLAVVIQLYKSDADVITEMTIEAFKKRKPFLAKVVRIR